MYGQAKDHTFRISKEKKNRKNNVELSIEPPTAKSYSSASGRFFHSGSHISTKLYAFEGAWCSNTVEPQNKGHFGTSNFCPQLSLIGRFPLFRGLNYIKRIVWGKKSCP